jgi:hypothetical protein
MDCEEMEKMIDSHIGLRRTIFLRHRAPGIDRISMNKHGLATSVKKYEAKKVHFQSFLFGSKVCGGNGIWGWSFEDARQ